MIVWKLPKEKRKLLIGRIQFYFETERDESIGELAAENLLDFMITELGPTLYNQAVHDAQRVVVEQMARVEEEMEMLEQPEDTAR